MDIWKNTSTLDGFDDGLNFTESKKDADIALIGSKPIDIDEMPKLKGIFRAGIGKDNVPEREASARGVVVRYPSEETISVIFEETSMFTCAHIFRMLYRNVGSLDPWVKVPRQQLSKKNLLIIGTGRIGSRVAELMGNFMQITTFDILQNQLSELRPMIQNADCITLHIPKSDDNLSFIDAEKLSWMKNGAVLMNTSRGEIVDENALFEVLQSGRIKAAFDVYWHEPYHGMLKKLHPDPFYMTPHVASTCKGFLEGCRRNLDDLIIELQ